MSKLYLLSQDTNSGYDTYDSCVVCADSEEEARFISPDEYRVWREGAWYFVYADGHWEDKPDQYGSWATNPEDVSVTYLGEADSNLDKGIVCSSFNAG